AGQILAHSGIAATVQPAPGPAPQIAAPEAAILKKVGDTYRGLTTYLMEGSLKIHVQSANGAQDNDIPFLIAATAGGKSRDEIRSETIGGSIVSNGKQTFLFNRQLRQY